MHTKHLISAAFLLLAFLAAAPAAAQLQLPDECNLSRQPGTPEACPPNAIGANSPNPHFTGARVEAGSDARSAIDAFGFCRYPGVGVGAPPLFAPFGNAEEWRAFITNHPTTAYMIQCSRGGQVAVPPNFRHDADENICVTTTTPMQYVTAPYKPANVPGDWTAPAVTYQCTTVDGTAFTETAVATLTPHDSGFGPSDDIGWTVAKVLYAYDGQCGPAKGVPAKIAPTEGLCHVGITTPIINNGLGPYSWICRGGNGGGRNVTCATNSPCETHKVSEGPCQCDTAGCYRPQYFGDSCGHTWIDKSNVCEKPEQKYPPDAPPNVDNTNG